MDRGAGEERHQDATGRRAMATQRRQVRSRHCRKQNGTEYSARRQAAADLLAKVRAAWPTSASPRLTAEKLTMAPILALETISKHFGAVVVAEGIDLALGEGEALGIIGPNGAGKTTLFGIATGTLAPDSGRVLFANEDITRLPPERRCRKGLARSFQVPQPFTGMTVFENVVVAAAFGANEREALVYDRCADLLQRCGLAGKANRPAGGLALLDRKRLELARALATKPRV